MIKMFEFITLGLLLTAGGVFVLPKIAAGSIPPEFKGFLPNPAIPQPGVNAHDVDILARTLYGEARGEGYSGMQAVANVIINRYRAGLASQAKARQFGATIADVCQKPYQFSTWNANDPNLEKITTVTSADPLFRQALEIAEKAVRGSLQDITGGADHYHTVYVSPSWSRGRTPIRQVGSHVFFDLA